MSARQTDWAMRAFLQRLEELPNREAVTVAQREVLVGIAKDALCICHPEERTAVHRDSREERGR